MYSIQGFWRKLFQREKSNKHELIKRLVEYKEKLMDHFVFGNNKGNNYDSLRNEIISNIDWPMDDYVNKNGCLWRAVSEFQDISNMNFQVNIFRWYELYADTDENLKKRKSNSGFLD